MNVFSNTDTNDNIAFIFRNTSAKLMLLDVNPAEPKWIEYKWSCLSDVIQIRQLNILPLNSWFNKYKYIIKKLKLRQTRTVELFYQHVLSIHTITVLNIKVCHRDPVPFPSLLPIRSSRYLNVHPSRKDLTKIASFSCRLLF